MTRTRSYSLLAASAGGMALLGAVLGLALTYLPEATSGPQWAVIAYCAGFGAFFGFIFWEGTYDAPGLTLDRARSKPWVLLWYALLAVALWIAVQVSPLSLSIYEVLLIPLFTVGVLYGVFDQRANRTRCAMRHKLRAEFAGRLLSALRSREPSAGHVKAITTIDVILAAIAGADRGLTDEALGYRRGLLAGMALPTDHTLNRFREVTQMLLEDDLKSAWMEANVRDLETRVGADLTLHGKGLQI